MQDSQAVPSPCRALCKLNEEQICIGCLRTKDEITVWSRASNADRQVIIDRLAALTPSSTR